MQPFTPTSGPHALEDWEFDGKEYVGCELVDPDHATVGMIREVFHDVETGELEWIDVATHEPGGSGWFSLGSESGRFVPAVGVEPLDTSTVRCAWSVRHVLDSPVCAEDLALTRNEEEQLLAHYGLPPRRQWINNGLPGGATMVGMPSPSSADPD